MGFFEKKNWPVRIRVFVHVRTWNDLWTCAQPYNTLGHAHEQVPNIKPIFYVDEHVFGDKSPSKGPYYTWKRARGLADTDMLTNLSLRVIDPIKYEAVKPLSTSSLGNNGRSRRSVEVLLVSMTKHLIPYLIETWIVENRRRGKKRRAGNRRAGRHIVSRCRLDAQTGC